MIVLLPAPPSVNELFFNRGGAGRVGRGVTKEYRQWRLASGHTMMAQRLRPVTGPVSIEVVIDRSCRNDLDNCLKAISDLLVEHRIIDGDGYKIVQRITIAFGAVPNLLGVRMGCRVEIRPYDGDAAATGNPGQRGNAAPGLAPS